MTTAKERMIHLLQELPDENSYEDLLRELALAHMIERGLQDSMSGRVMDSEEVAGQIASWAK